MLAVNDGYSFDGALTNATPSPDCARVIRGQSAMRSKPRITVEVKVNLASCLWPVLWFISLYV